MPGARVGSAYSGTSNLDPLWQDSRMATSLHEDGRRTATSSPAQKVMRASWLKNQVEPSSPAERKSTVRPGGKLPFGRLKL